MRVVPGRFGALIGRRRTAIALAIAIACIAVVPTLVSAVMWRWSGTGANAYFFVEDGNGGYTDLSIWAQDGTTIFHGASNGQPPWANDGGFRNASGGQPPWANEGGFHNASGGQPPWANPGGFRNASQGGPTTSEMASADVYIFRYIPPETEDGVGTWVDIWGWTSEVDFMTHARLGGATLSASMDGWMATWGDTDVWGPVQIATDLTWTSTGPMYRFRSSGMWSDTYFRNMWSSNGLARSASVMGEVWVDGAPFINGTEGWGEVSTDRSIERWQ